MVHDIWIPTVSKVVFDPYLLGDGPDVLEWQGLELVVLEKVVQILLEHLKDQAGVVLVSEALEGANEVELVGILLAQPRQDAHFNLKQAKKLVRFIIMKSFFLMNWCVYSFG